MSITEIAATERRKQYASWLLCGAAMLLIGAVQRDRRALLMDMAPRATAFTAIAPALPAGGSGIALAARTGLPVGLFRPRRPIGGAAGTQGFFVRPQGYAATGAGADAPAPGAAPSDGDAGTGTGTGTTSQTLAANGTGAGSGSGGGGTQTVGAGPLAGGGVAGPVGAVPEPATWMMMILGFGGIGCLLRRRRVGGEQKASAAFS